MTLLSYSFIFIFLPLVLVGYYFLNSRKLYVWGKVLLAVFSLVFYYSVGYKGFIALLLSMIICYGICQYAFRDNISIYIKKSLLVIGIVLNVVALLYCKYLTYFEIILNKYTGSAFIYTAIVVPLGISYFTFSQIAYIVDSYRDNSIKYSPVDYILFISFFPKITVGPICYTTELIPQFNDISRKSINYTNMTRGFYRLTLGLAKKLLLADNLGTFVDIGYLNIAALGTTNSLLVITAYTLQIYFDFSGYCDVALGICRMLNLDIIDNFDAPYHSLSIAEFWKRWHISLTRFFRNYVYIPLGGNRKGKIRTYINTLIIFLISGLWHGSATTFIVWGLVHGIGSIVSKIISPVSKKLPKFVRWFLTFSFVNLAWVLFRSPDMNTAMMMYKQLLAGGIKPIDINIVATCIPVEGQLIQQIILRLAPAYTYYSGSIILIALIAIALFFSTRVKTAATMASNFVMNRKHMIIMIILFVWSVLSLSQVSEFIYVNF